LATDPI